MGALFVADLSNLMTSPLHILTSPVEVRASFVLN